MAATITHYKKFKLAGYDGSDLDLANDTIKLALCTSAYTPAQAHDFFDDITNELSGGGYTAGGNTLACSIGYVDNNVKFDAPDEDFTALTGTNVRYGIIYKDTGTATTSPLIGYVDFGADKTFADATLRFAWHANGISVIS